MNHIFGFDPLVLIILWAFQVFIAAAIYFDARKKELNAVFWSGITLIPLVGFISFVAYIIMTHIEEDRPFDLLQQRLFRGMITDNEYGILYEDLKKSYMAAADRDTNPEMESQLEKLRREFAEGELPKDKFQRASDDLLIKTPKLS
jgi:uncharacterized membrane protein